MPKVLIIDHSKSMRNTLRERLGYEGFTIETAEDFTIATRLIESIQFDLILCDAESMPLNSKIPFIVLSDNGSIDAALEAIRNGARDYLTRPINMNRLLESIQKVIGTQFFQEESSVEETQTHHSQRKLRPLSCLAEPIIGSSSATEEVRKMIDKVAPHEARVLITGENGTGKELVAHWLHVKSNRSQGPFVAVNCAAIPSELVESELFGHERGAFTSAIKQRRGKFEQADGGTLFMDEIGDMSLSAQTKVLRTLQERKICRVGSDKDIAVNVRIMAATNKDLREEIIAGRFREDLYHRIAVLEIKVPPLREHPEDIPELVSHFIKLLAEEYKGAPKEIDPLAMEALQRKPWSGNIRELKNIVERLMILSEERITLADVEQYC